MAYQLIKSYLSNRFTLLAIKIQIHTSKDTRKIVTILRAYDMFGGVVFYGAKYMSEKISLQGVAIDPTCN